MNHRPLILIFPILLVCAAAALAVPDATDQDQEQDGWRPLIGEGLAGWKADKDGNEKYWENQDGVIVGENPDKHGSILWTTDSYQDFELIVEYRTPSEDYDSGIFTRADSHQVQIGISRSLKKDLTACIYAPKDGDGGYPAISDKPITEIHKPGQWNTLRIIVQGKRIQTFLNGQAMVDYQAKTIPERGPVGLQLHMHVHMKMEFKNIRIRPLDE